MSKGRGRVGQHRWVVSTLEEGRLQPHPSSLAAAAFRSASSWTPPAAEGSDEDVAGAGGDGGAASSKWLPHRWVLYTDKVSSAWVHALRATACMLACLVASLCVFLQTGVLWRSILVLYT